ncbi:MAG: hypothetical protein IJ268_10945, partial [Proteobacteria bacterium]|nr:hypothetical protein [Pseudomonadota bacterium]
MMKKLACLIAALSLCAVSFTACDDNNDNDAAIECSNNSDCQDNAEGKTVCSEDSKCVAPEEDPAPSDKLADGADCEANDACASGICGEDKKCAPAEDAPSDKLADGADCEANDACASGICGEDKKCAPAEDAPADKLADGADCEANDACASGICGEDKKCAPA